MVKRSIAFVLVICMLMVTACGSTPAETGGNDSKQTGNDSSAETKTPVSSDGQYELALITDSGDIDDRSFTQGAWEGLEQFAKETGKTYQYYRSTESSTDGKLNGIQMAVDNGAKVIVCPGYNFEDAVYFAQDKYPDVKFILLDGVPQNGDYTDYKTADNTYSIVFSEDHAGFLAGYAAVSDGYRDLGFLGGMAVPAVVRYGYGFLQGADAAAKDLGLAQGEVKIKFGYTGDFASTPENQTKAASWYQSGTEVIFSCGGIIINSVTAAAESQDNAKVIGVDVDQSGESETVITSAMKYMPPTIYQALTEIYNDEFKGGQNVCLGIEDDAVGLPEDFSRFENFTVDQYNQIYDTLKADQDGILSNILRDTSDDGNVSLKEVIDICELIEVQEIN